METAGSEGQVNPPQHIGGLHGYLRKEGGLGRVSKPWRWSLAIKSLRSAEILFPILYSHSPDGPPTSLCCADLCPNSRVGWNASTLWLRSVLVELLLSTSNLSVHHPGPWSHIAPSQTYQLHTLLQCTLSYLQGPIRLDFSSLLEERERERAQKAVPEWAIFSDWLKIPRETFLGYHVLILLPRNFSLLDPCPRPSFSINWDSKYLQLHGKLLCPKLCTLWGLQCCLTPK